MQLMISMFQSWLFNFIAKPLTASYQFGLYLQSNITNRAEIHFQSMFCGVFTLPLIDFATPKLSIKKELEIGG